MKFKVGEPPERVILASGSPRRQEMLRALAVPFEVHVSRVPEPLHGRKSAQELAEELAVSKARTYDGGSGALVIAMDSIVTVGRRKLGKPDTPDEARNMLHLLNGRTHQVVTGAALIWKGQTVSGSASTKVEFREITPAEIDWYVESGEPLDKAGAYAIQGLGRIFINRIDGCYYNVVGFPLTLFQQLLQRFDLTILDLTQSR